MREVGMKHLIDLLLQSLQFVALLEVPLLGVVLDEVVDPVEGILDLRETRLDVARGREGGCCLADGFEFEGVGLPAVVVELVDELVPLLVVELGRIEILCVVARDHVEVVDIGI